MSTQLSAHFALEEFMTPRVPEDYPAALVDSHLRPLVDRLEWARELAGVPGIVTSAYRSPAHNVAIGGAEDSQHVDGDAADVEFLLIPLRIFAQRVADAVDAGAAPAFGQVIFYRDKPHVHVSNPAAKLGDRNGELLYSPGVDANGARIYQPLSDALGAGDVPTLSQPQTREGLLASLSPWSFLRSPSRSHFARGGFSNV